MLVVNERNIEQVFHDIEKVISSNNHANYFGRRHFVQNLFEFSSQVCYHLSHVARVWNNLGRELKNTQIFLIDADRERIRKGLGNKESLQKQVEREVGDDALQV